MEGALIILLVLVVVGAILYVHHRLTYGKAEDKAPEAEEKPVPAPAAAEPAPAQEGHGQFCCGLHAVCDKDLPPMPGEKVEYYDDEELDRFAGRNPEEYTDDEIEEFRDVLLTLLPEDITGWHRSLQLRGIVMPPIIKDELLMIISENHHA
ncbi:MAG: phospholipase [Bacteroidales bacterium]|nr:phospholipase [Bacteroidales bacterium]